MGQTTERELQTKALDDKAALLIMKAESDFGKKNVAYSHGEDGSIVITIRNSRGKISRKEHKLPEHVRKDGD